MGYEGPLKALNTKLILDDHGNNLDSFRISLESFRPFIGPLLHKPVTVRNFFCRFLQQTGSNLDFQMIFDKVAHSLLNARAQAI